MSRRRWRNGEFIRNFEFGRDEPVITSHLSDGKVYQSSPVSRRLLNDYFLSSRLTGQQIDLPPKVAEQIANKLSMAYMAPNWNAARYLSFTLYTPPTKPHSRKHCARPIELPGQRDIWHEFRIGDPL